MVKAEDYSQMFLFSAHIKKCRSQCYASLHYDEYGEHGTFTTQVKCYTCIGMKAL